MISTTGFDPEVQRSFPSMVIHDLAYSLQNYVVWSVSYASAFVRNRLTIIRTFLALSTHCYWMSSPSRKWERGVNPRFPLVVFVSVWWKSRKLGGRGSPRFPTAMVERFSADLLPAIKSYWPETHLESYTASPKPRSVKEHLTSLLFWISCLTITHTRLSCLPKMS